MKGSSIKLHLRAGERIYINGAVVRVDRKTALEILNDASFLLENHVLQVEDAVTPVKQLYFVAQSLLMDPVESRGAKDLFRRMVVDTLKAVGDDELSAGIKTADAELSGGNPFQALKTLRRLFELEADLMSTGPVTIEAEALPSRSAAA